MSLRYLRHAEINLAAWDACVAASQAAVPYAYSWWLGATAKQWDAVVELHAETDAYTSVLPLPCKWRPWGRQVYQPAFTQQLGLLTTKESQHRVIADYLAMTAGRFSRFYTQANVNNLVPPLPADFTFTERRTYLLDLATDYATLQARYSADYRRRLRRNLEQVRPLIVTEAVAAKELIQLFRRHKGGEVAGLKAWHYEQLNALMKALQARQLARIVEVRQPDTDNLLAGALFVQHQAGLIYLFAAASPAGKQAGAPLLLLDHMIRQHAGTPGLVLDFEGGIIPSIARFFANFGATPASYAALSYSTRQPWYLLWKP
ncbi:GNAT family N-acetyltransferase [Hymenobacter crusticola]|uniref:BioF2-like acetyltransferase domain-containing protein n=1 Tax=Hymenobacter crusticola TaxID=1770526 RepID=A0A243W8W4_9BACT|nr:GNAT family N-acetyltransferase [Hymenobacter crusticola]OUJ71603.1 hypothetical protein BXP70_21170 [Hymenobacter crusticola]